MHLNMLISLAFQLSSISYACGIVFIWLFIVTLTFV